MQLYIDFKSYSFDNQELSVGKIYFRLGNNLFPKVQLGCFVDYVLQIWVEGLIQLLETKEEGLYELSFENMTQEWVIDHEGDDQKIVVQFLDSGEMVHSEHYSLTDILDGIIPEIKIFLNRCDQEGFENEELEGLKERFLILEQLRKELT